MISFMVSVVPQKIDRAAEPPELMIVAESSGPVLPPLKAGSIWSARAVAFARCDLGGDHAPGDHLATSQLPEPRRGPDDYPEPSAADIPAVDADVDSGELSAAQFPQVLEMHDAGDGTQVRSCSREPPRGNQYLGRGQDAHHDSMGTCGARWPPRQRDRRPQGGSPAGSLNGCQQHRRPATPSHTGPRDACSDAAWGAPPRLHHPATLRNHLMLKQRAIRRGVRPWLNPADT